MATTRVRLTGVASIVPYYDVVAISKSRTVIVTVAHGFTFLACHLCQLDRIVSLDVMEREEESFTGRFVRTKIVWDKEKM